jgi:hypothetical protein
MTIVGSDPFDGGAPDMMSTDPGSWTWLEPEPTEWRPAVAMGDSVTVTFHTHTGLGCERIARHVDRYRPGSYVAEREETEVARGPGGYVF